MTMKKRDLKVFFNSGAERIFKNVSNVQFGKPREFNGEDNTPLFIEYDRECNGGIKRGCCDAIPMCSIDVITEIDGSVFNIENVLGYQEWFNA